MGVVVVEVVDVGVVVVVSVVVELGLWKIDVEGAGVVTEIVKIPMITSLLSLIVCDRLLKIIVARNL